MNLYLNRFMWLIGNELKATVLEENKAITTKETVDELGLLKIYNF